MMPKKGSGGAYRLYLPAKKAVLKQRSKPSLYSPYTAPTASTKDMPKCGGMMVQLQFGTSMPPNDKNPGRPKYRADAGLSGARALGVPTQRDFR